MDNVSRKKRRKIMAANKSKNTKPEKLVRSILYGMGYRFRIHVNLPGTPDIVLYKYKTIIFVHGCFWHNHTGCSKASLPKTRRKFWRDKFANNRKREKKNEKELKEAGWKVVIVWECDLKDEKKLSKRLKGILDRRLKSLERNDNDSSKKGNSGR